MSNHKSSSGKSLDRMTLAELCDEANRIKQGVVAYAEELSAVYSLLYSRVRREPPNDLTYSYLSVASSGKRFSSTILQASKRTTGIEAKALLRGQQLVEETERRKREVEAQRKRIEEKKSHQKTDPLEAVFGVPLYPTDQVEFDSISSSYIDDSKGPSSDLDELYGEELD